MPSGSSWRPGPPEPPWRTLHGTMMRPPPSQVPPPFQVMCEAHRLGASKEAPICGPGLGGSTVPACITAKQLQPGCAWLHSMWATVAEGGPGLPWSFHAQQTAG